MANEKEIMLRDQLITIDDKRFITYQFGNHTLKQIIINDIKRFEIPPKRSSDSTITFSDDEMRAVWNILNQIYGEEK